TLVCTMLYCSVTCNYRYVLFILFIVFISLLFLFIFFFFNDPAPTEIYTLSLHDALPITKTLDGHVAIGGAKIFAKAEMRVMRGRSEEHTSELQSRFDLVCRLLLEKKKKKKKKNQNITENKKQQNTTRYITKRNTHSLPYP